MNEFLLENLVSNESLSAYVILANNLVAIAAAFFVMFTYKLTYSGAAYSRKFNISLGMITLITTMIMSSAGTARRKTMNACFSVGRSPCARSSGCLRA